MLLFQFDSQVARLIDQIGNHIDVLKSKYPDSEIKYVTPKASIFETIGSIRSKLTTKMLSNSRVDF